MTATFNCWMRRSATGAIALTLATALAGCSVSSDTAASAVAVPSSFTPGQAQGPRIVVWIHGYVVTARLSNTSEARQFAALLPLSVDLKDVWGQAKSGPLPRPLPPVEAARPVHRPTPGGIYLWPGTDVIAIYYDDLGQSVPDPGLVQLGVIETGLDAIADAGRRSTVSIELAAAPAR